MTYRDATLPDELVDFMGGARPCDSAECGGVYFADHVTHVELVDLCDAGRVPFVSHLCTPACARAMAAPDAGSRARGVMDW